MELNLSNKKVLVVGASKGIGRGIVNGFAKENTNLVIVARTEELLKGVQKEALLNGAVTCEYVVKDIMNCDTKLFARDLLTHFGYFDIIVHNVGGSLVSRN